MSITEDTLFIDSYITDKHITGHIFVPNIDEPIGSYEGNVGIRDELISIIKVNEQYRELGIGFKAFDRVFKALSQHTKILTIVGAWYKDEEFSYLPEGKSTNLLAYQNQINEGEHPQIAAFNTPTGRWARRLGFDKAYVVSANEKNVQVAFVKD
jgi:hypothetical protein